MYLKNRAIICILQYVADGGGSSSLSNRWIQVSNGMSLLSGQVGVP